MLYDTEFLINYSGQRGRAKRARAARFVDAHLDAPLYTSRVCWAEFAEGCETKELVSGMLAPFTIIELSEPIAWAASRISRNLNRAGLPIGDNDVWIAATALAYRIPLVSLNAKHFDRVPGLEIEEY